MKTKSTTNTRTQTLCACAFATLLLSTQTSNAAVVALNNADVITALDNASVTVTLAPGAGDWNLNSIAVAVADATATDLEIEISGLGISTTTEPVIVSSGSISIKDDIATFSGVVLTAGNTYTIQASSTGGGSGGTYTTVAFFGNTTGTHPDWSTTPDGLIFSLDASLVPEPSSSFLLAISSLCLATRRRR